MAREARTPRGGGSRARRWPWRGAGPWAFGAALALAIAGPATTQGCLVDWKLFDGTSTLDPALCFFDASGVSRAHGRELVVWTKCIGEREVNAIDPTGPTGRAIAARNAQALLMGYVPPAASLNGLDTDGRMSVISYESAADLADLKPRSSIYYELNCARGTARAVRLRPRAAAGLRIAPRALNAAVPRGTGTSLLELLCGPNVDPQPMATVPAAPRASQSRPLPGLHLATAAREPRVHVAALERRPRGAQRRAPVSSRAVSPSSLDATLRPRLG
jgi:hypothetical protein